MYNMAMFNVNGKPNEISPDSAVPLILFQHLLPHCFVFSGPQLYCFRLVTLLLSVLFLVAGSYFQRKSSKNIIVHY